MRQFSDERRTKMSIFKRDKPVQISEASMQAGLARGRATLAAKGTPPAQGNPAPHCAAHDPQPATPPDRKNTQNT